jgi:eukaryotic-like serine/threonine-protein kinase
VPAIGEVIADRYRLEEQLGVGGMGSVFRATHVTLASEVAIKIIKRSAALDPRSLARFERESLLAAKIKSEHVVRVMDHGHHGELPFIVMEYLAGEDLRQRLRDRGRLDLKDTALMVKHVCRALAAAHEIGLVHRDVKPENIFISPGEDVGEERIRVLDFGVAKVSDSIALGGLDPTQTGALIGTPYYLSPEQARGLKTVGPPADLWSLAVVAFECLTGERPFNAAAMGPLIAMITHGAIPVPSQVLGGLPPALDGWFKKALCREPEGRFESAREMGRSFAIAAGIGESFARESAVLPRVSLPTPLSVEQHALRSQDHTMMLDSSEDLVSTIALPSQEIRPSQPMRPAHVAGARTVALPDPMPLAPRMVAPAYHPPQPQPQQQPQPQMHGHLHAPWPVAPPPRTSKAPFIAIAVALVLLGGGAATAFALGWFAPQPTPAARSAEPDEEEEDIASAPLPPPPLPSSQPPPPPSSATAAPPPPAPVTPVPVVPNPVSTGRGRSHRKRLD